MIAAKKKSLPGKGYHGTLVEGFDGRWDAVKLRRILKKKSNFKELWSAITKREIDPEKLNEAVEEGLIKKKEIQAAWVEVPRKPYLRLFEEGADDDALDGILIT
jgi:DNA-binding HxlR family transcriptional regulator